MGQCCSCCCFRRDRNPLYEPLLQESEREAVSDLLRYLENRPDSGALFEEEALNALTTLSYSQNIDLQRSAALAFAEITERQVQEVDATVLDPLLHLLRSSTDVEVQRASSAALGNLAVAVANKVKIVRLGGLASLISQMTSPNVEVQCNAVGCITNLATHEENKSAIARSGALGPLVRLARNSRDVRVMRNATGALLNMTHSEENRRELVDCGAVPVLAYLLHQHNNLNGKHTAKGGDVDVVYYCTTAVSNLAVDVLNRRKLYTEKTLIADLVELMSAQNPAKIRCQAALALRNLASDESYQVDIALNPLALERMLELLQTPVDTPQNAQLVLAAVACIRNISIHPLNEHKIIRAGFLVPLVQLVKNIDIVDEARCHAISTLRNLAAGASDTVINTAGGGSQSIVAPSSEASSESKLAIIKSGALEAIKEIIDQAMSVQDLDAISWSVLSETTACLAVLALSDSLKPYLFDLDIVKSLLRILSSEVMAVVPPEIQGNAAATLGNLATKCPDLKFFTSNSNVWNEICSYIERFLSGTVASTDTDGSFIAGDIGVTYQHIAIWTVLQFLDREHTGTKRDGYNKIVSLILNRAQMVNLIERQAELTQGAANDQYEDEIVALARKVLSILKSQ